MISENPAILIIDVQKAIDHPGWRGETTRRRSKTSDACCRHGVKLATLLQ